MATRAFDKIMAGVNEARAYVDGTADKTRYGFMLPASASRDTNRAGPHIALVH